MQAQQCFHLFAGFDTNWFGRGWDRQGPTGRHSQFAGRIPCVHGFDRSANALRLQLVALRGFRFRRSTRRYSPRANRGPHHASLAKSGRLIADFAADACIGSCARIASRTRAASRRPHVQQTTNGTTETNQPHMTPQPTIWHSLLSHSPASPTTTCEPNNKAIKHKSTAAISPTAAAKRDTGAGCSPSFVTRHPSEWVSRQASRALNAPTLTNRRKCSAEVASITSPNWIRTTNRFSPCQSALVIRPGSARLLSRFKSQVCSGLRKTCHHVKRVASRREHSSCIFRR